MQKLLNNILKQCAIYTNPIKRKLTYQSLGHMGQHSAIYTGILDRQPPSKPNLLKLGQVLDHILTEYSYIKIKNQLVDWKEGNYCTTGALHVEYITDWPEENELDEGIIEVTVTVCFNVLGDLHCPLVLLF